MNLQDCVKAQQNRAYAQKVKISNLQQMANTIVYIQQHGYDSYDELKKARDELSAKMSDARNTAKSTDADLKRLNEQIHYLGQYLSTKTHIKNFYRPTIRRFIVLSIKMKSPNMRKPLNS